MKYVSPAKLRNLFQIIKNILGKLLYIVLIWVGSRVLVPFVGGQTVGYAASVLGIGVEFHETGHAVVAYVSPSRENERVCSHLKVPYYVRL